MILGIGVDLVDVERFARAARRLGEGFVDRILTSAEVADCRATRRPDEHHAARFAAREALLKALGTGLAGRMSWRDIEVRAGEGPGTYSVVLAGAVREAAAALGVRRVHLALSTTRAIAAASVILED